MSVASLSFNIKTRDHGSAAGFAGCSLALRNLSLLKAKMALSHEPPAAEHGACD